MAQLPPASFSHHCARLTAPRCPYAPHSRHLLMDIVYTHRLTPQGVFYSITAPERVDVL